MRRNFIITLALIAAPLSLSACGLKGDLKTPPPIWGEDTRSAEDIAANAPSTKSNLTTE